MSEREPIPKIVTLGPSGSDHERTAKFFLNSLGLSKVAEIELVEDIVSDGLERVRTDPASFLLQCSAHLQTNVVNMQHHREVVMMAAFMYPIKELGLLVRSGVMEPASLGYMPATLPYLNRRKWPTIEELFEETSKPIVGRNLLEGKYDAGITSTEWAERNPDELRVGETIGEVNTAWLAYRNINADPLPNIDEVFGIKPIPPFHGTGGSVA